VGAGAVISGPLVVGLVAALSLRIAGLVAVAVDTSGRRLTAA